MHCCENLPLTSKTSKHKLTLIEKAKGSKSNIVLGNNSALKSVQDYFICCPFLLADWSRLSKFEQSNALQCSYWMKESSTKNPVTGAPSAGHDSVTKDSTLDTCFKTQMMHGNARNCAPKRLGTEEMHIAGISTMMIMYSKTNASPSQQKKIFC